MRVRPVFSSAGGTGLKLKDALADPELGGRKAVISHASRVLAGIWEKGMVSHTFIHRVLNEYLAEVRVVELGERGPAAQNLLKASSHCASECPFGTPRTVRV